MSEFISVLISTPMGVAIGVLFNWFKDRHKTDNDITLQNLEGAKIVQGMSLSMVESYVAEQERMKENSEALEAKLAELNGEVDKLIAELRLERRKRVKAEDERDLALRDRDYYKELAER